MEEYDDPETVAENALLLLAGVEKRDETAPEVVARRATAEIAAHATDLKVQTIVLHPFAHLFGRLSQPAVEMRVLRMVEEGLRAGGLAVTRTPFGWFNTLDIRAKGHPLSRVARTVRAGGADPRARRRQWPFSTNWRPGMMAGTRPRWAPWPAAQGTGPALAVAGRSLLQPPGVGQPAGSGRVRGVGRAGGDLFPAPRLGPVAGCPASAGATGSPLGAEDGGLPGRGREPGTSI